MVNPSIDKLQTINLLYQLYKDNITPTDYRKGLSFALRSVLAMYTEKPVDIRNLTNITIKYINESIKVLGL